MFSKEESSKAKNQIIEQISKSQIPNKEEIIKSVNSMNEKEFVDFLKQNNLLKSDGKESCIFCSIVDKKLPSHAIDENDEALAVLEINPISKGHSIVIPKIHSKDASKKSYELAKNLSEKISDKLKPKKIEIINDSNFGHEIINVLPIYNKESIHSQRKKETDIELKNIQKQLLAQKKVVQKPKKEDVVEKTIITDKNTWLPKRFP